jgi:GGDEF domain-containing protein
VPLSAFSRRRAPTNEPDLTSAQRRAVPRHCDAVAEALAAQRSPMAACAAVGSTLAADGVSLGEALSALSATYAALGLGEPAFAPTEALSLSWSEETLTFLNDVSCEDPLTGLASTAHLRARLAEVYREGARAGSAPRSTHALLVVDLAISSSDPREPHDPFGQALCLAGAAEMVREEFSGGETFARAGSDKVVALVRREPHLGATVASLRQTLQEARFSPRPRIWIEGLPDDADTAVMVLSGLSLL